MHHQKWVYILSWGTIFFGIVLRLRQFFFNRSLWLDEAALSLNIMSRSYTRLAQPLDYNQGAPIGFLFVEKSITSIFGPSEFTLRLFPLLCSIISLIIFLELAKYVLNSFSIPLSIFLLAVSKNLIYYSSEVKQYSIDVFVVLVLLFFACEITTKGLTWGRLIFFSFFGSMVIWFSHPALFVLAGTGSYFLISSIQKRRWEKIPWVLIMGMSWLLSFGIIYFLSLRSLETNEVLTNFWKNYFAPFPPKNLEDILWYINTLKQIFKETLGFPLPKLAIYLSFIGLIALLIKKHKIFWLILSPLPFLILASAANRYPIYGRLILFSIPILIILITKGIEIFYRIIPRYSYIPTLLLVGMMLYPQINNAIEIFVNPMVKEEIKPILNYITLKRQPGDMVYVYYGSYYAFKYYNTVQYNIDNYVIGVSSRENPKKYFDDLDKLPKHKRVWFIFSHVYNGKFGNEEELIIDTIDKQWKQLEHITAPGASGYLYVSDK